MDGLRTIMKRIMMSKLTRFLSIVTVFAIIALIVVYVLKNNGTIAWSSFNPNFSKTYLFYKEFNIRHKILFQPKKLRKYFRAAPDDFIYSLILITDYIYSDIITIDKLDFL